MAAPATPVTPARKQLAQLTAREQQVAARVGELHHVDFTAMTVVSNLYRVAGAVRNVLEQQILASDGLSWTGFTALYVLWIWGPMEARHLADECGVSKGTLTGVIRTLESKGLVARSAHATDGRLVTMNLTPLGTRTIKRLFPTFNGGETAVVSVLAKSEQTQLASLLRRVLGHAELLATDQSRR